MIHDRARYVVRGCRCFTCRVANARYVSEQAKGLHRKVSAEDARAHLAFLKSQGIGVRAVARATGISSRTLNHIKAGRRLIWRRTHYRILAVTADDNIRARIPAGPTHALVDEMVGAGIPRSHIAQEGLGNRYRGKGNSTALQLGSQWVRSDTARKIRSFHDRVLLENSPRGRALRARCGCSGSPEAIRRAEQAKRRAHYRAS